MEGKEITKALLEHIGENTSREGLLQTPDRMVRAYAELFRGYKEDPKDLFTSFEEGACIEMVVLKNCEFFSTCEHHFLPFYGKISIGYLPNNKVVGISKLARLVDNLSAKMQIQERLVAEIADLIESELDAHGVIVVAEAVHFCMTSRGVKKQSTSMVTQATRGIFVESATATNEFFNLLRL